MTAPRPTTSGRLDGPEAAGLPLDACLARLESAIDAARDLGVGVDDALTVRDDAVARLGFPSDALVVALVGGTGVGKSSIVNALAGADISAASVRRPTTASPVAWLASGSTDDLRPLLDWLSIAPSDVHAAPHDEAPGPEPSSGGLAIVDLPDLDSIEPAHRARVDAALPRVDAVIWVTDPEKYHDARLHDELLVRWLPRLGRQLVVVNKADRLTGSDAELLRRDLERDIDRMAGPGARAASGERPPSGERPASGRIAVVLASTRGPLPGTPGRAAPGPADDGLAAVRSWLADAAREKQVARRRLLATIRDTIASLAREAGVDAGRDPGSLLAEAARRTAADGASDALLRVVGLDALRRQAVAATRARARGRGAGPLGGLTSRLFRWSGREARVADPSAFLARWRDRGTPGPAAAVVRAALSDSLRTASPGTRRRLAADTAPEPLERALAGAVDRAIVTDRGIPPTSRWWTVIGLAQTVATGALVLSAIWVGLWVLIKFPADAVVVPVIGQVPMPFVAIIVSLVAGYVLARLLGFHAGWLGRRWAERLASRIAAGVREEVAGVAFRPVDLIDADRERLRAAARGAASDCRYAG